MAAHSTRFKREVDRIERRAPETTKRRVAVAMREHAEEAAKVLCWPALASSFEEDAKRLEASCETSQN